MKLRMYVELLEGHWLISPYHILIIEDDPNDIELIRFGFKKHDEFFLDFSFTGGEAIEKISKSSYDLISLDFALPDISGLDVLERVRELDSHIPVVMVTGLDTEDLQVIAFQKQATSYVAKSVDSFRSLPYVFEALIKEAKFKSVEQQMKLEINRSGTLSRYILDNSPVGIYVLQDGFFKLANSKFGELFGYETDNLLDKPFSSIIDPEEFDHVSEMVRKVGGGGFYVSEFRISRKDGSKRWAEARIVPVTFKNERWILGIIIDVTERRNTEAELVKRNRELSLLHDIMMKAVDFKGSLDDFLGNILADVMIGLHGSKSEKMVGGVFVLENDRLVLKSYNGLLGELIEFIEENNVENLLGLPQLNKEFRDTNEGRLNVWVSAPINYKGSPKGLLVVGGGEYVENTFNSFLEDLASHIGCAMELFQLCNFKKGLD